MDSTTYTLITGASGGIGKELALIAAREGRNVVLVARRRGALTKLARELTKRYDIYSEVIAADLTSADAVETIQIALRRKKITVGILINNAGFGSYGNFAMSDKASQLAMIDLNIRALTELTHALLPTLLAQKQAYIMNLGSVAGFLPGPLMSVYFASKAYVLHFSEALAEELRGSGVSVTCLCPGSTKTGFGEVARVSATHSTRTSRVTAREVAEYGWRAMKRKKRVAVYGFSNRLSLVLIRFLPKAAVTRIVHRIQR